MVALKSRKLLLGALVVLGASALPARAQFLMSDPVDEILEGIGLKSVERDKIDYRERAPIVVPPSSGKLRAPEEAAANRNSQWPQDPDVLARKRRAEQAKLPSGYQANETRDRLLVDPATGQRRNNMAGVPTARGGNVLSDGVNPATILTREQVGRINATAEPEKTLQPGVEPSRQYLTDPPKGYRRAAAGASTKATMEPMRPQGDQIQINALRPAN